jgi:hypothetical protein
LIALIAPLSSSNILLQVLQAEAAVFYTFNDIPKTFQIKPEAVDAVRHAELFVPQDLDSFALRNASSFKSSGDIFPE